jgi:phosphoribosylanthranilate isomerase
VRTLPPFVVAVGVFVDMPPVEVARILGEAGLTLPQFHGAEPPDEVRAFARALKAIRISGERDLAAMEAYAVSAFLLDTYVAGTPGGTGRSFDWGLAREAAARARVVLAGGLTPENVADAVRLVQPYGVDVSSGVEISPGLKDHARVRAFIERAKCAG